MADIERAGLKEQLKRKLTASITTAELRRTMIKVIHYYKEVSEFEMKTREGLQKLEKRLEKCQTAKLKAILMTEILDERINIDERLEQLEQLEEQQIQPPSTPSVSGAASMPMPQRILSRRRETGSRKRRCSSITGVSIKDNTNI